MEAVKELRSSFLMEDIASGVRDDLTRDMMLACKLQGFRVVAAGTLLLWAVLVEAVTLMEDIACGAREDFRRGMMLVGRVEEGGVSRGWRSREGRGDGREVERVERCSDGMLGLVSRAGAGVSVGCRIPSLSKSGASGREFCI
jgi:hypothetical protein